MFKFKIADQVLVTTGREKGKKGKIEKIFAGDNKVVITGINIYKSLHSLFHIFFLMLSFFNLIIYFS